jgi:SagB-type dehydrogenase family enzyme
MSSDPSTSDKKQELRDLVELLSEYECTRLLPIMKDVAIGERFWEDDVGLFYNEFVKSRYSLFVRNPGAYLGTEYAPISIDKEFRGAEKVALPTPDKLLLSLDEILQNRRSRRECAQKAISLTHLSTVLLRGFGLTGRISAYGFNNLPLHASPSSGALSAMEVYLFVQSVNGLKPGLYHYNASSAALEFVKPGYHAPTMRAWLPGQPWAADAPVVLLFAGVYERLRWKYGARSYRYMCMDIGFLCENFYLVAESMGLAFCAVAGFIEDELEAYLEIDGQTEMALLVASLGVRAA